MSHARARLQASPTQFANPGWRDYFVGLAPRYWSILLDTIYAAYVVTHATRQTDPDFVIVAHVGLLGGCEYLAMHLAQDDHTVLAAGLRNDAIAAAQAFHGRLG